MYQQEYDGNQRERGGTSPRGRLSDEQQQNETSRKNVQQPDAGGLNRLNSYCIQGYRSHYSATQHPNTTSVAVNIQASSPASATSFPVKLHRVLQLAETEGFQSVISWCTRNDIDEWSSSGGTAFKVHDPKKFVDEIIPRFFPTMSKFNSFVRQLNLWGFSRVRSKDSLANGSYRHPGFSHNHWDLSHLCMKRTKTKGLYVRGSGGAKTAKHSNGRRYATLGRGISKPTPARGEQDFLFVPEKTHTSGIVMVPPQKESSSYNTSSLPLPSPLAVLSAASAAGSFHSPLMLRTISSGTPSTIPEQRGSISDVTINVASPHRGNDGVVGLAPVPHQGSQGDMIPERDFRYIMLGIEIGQRQQEVECIQLGVDGHP
jgi:HSF-type DNA-binding